MLLLLTLLAAAQITDPLAPARAGMLQCYAPSAARKTCRSIAGYARRADGSYLNTAQLLLAPTRGLAIETATVVRVKHGAICGPLARADLLAGKVIVNGRTLPGADASAVLEKIADAYAAAGALDKEVCTTYTPQGAQFSAEATVEGVAKPELTQPVIWISPSDGYTLGTP